LIDHHIQRVLTKGGKVKNAFEGKENLKKWVNKYGSQIEILPGGGITHENYQELVLFTGVS
jgi:copper homeostasis protein